MSDAMACPTTASSLRAGITTATGGAGVLSFGESLLGKCHRQRAGVRTIECRAPEAAARQEQVQPHGQRGRTD